MRSKPYLVGLACILTGGLLAGCMPKMTAEDMKNMKPQRPSQLDKLNMFEGKWSYTGTMNVMGLDKPLQGTGTSKIEWTLDGWFLEGDEEHNIPDMGAMKGKNIMTWDPGSKKYRSWWFSDWGIGSGTMKYNEKTNTWTIKGKGGGGMGATRGKGTVTIIDDKTQEWTWKEYPWWDYLGLMKVMEYKGTGKKQ